MAKNTNPADAAINDVETDGRKSRGKRPVYFYGVPAGTKIEEVKQAGENWSQQDAEAELKAKLGDDCIIVGPKYDVRGVKTESTSLTVKVDLRTMDFSSDKFTGHHQGWKVFGNGVAACEVNGEKFEDNDLVQIQVESLVDVNDKTPKPRINMKIVRRSMIEHLVAA